MILPALLGWVASIALADSPAADAPPPPPPPSENPDVSALEARIAALEAALRDREMADLLREADAAAPVTTASAPSLFPMNPGITAFGDLVGQLGLDPEGVRPGSTMYLRSMELDISATVDPFAKATAVIAFEQEAPPMDGSAAAGDFGAGPEEAYVDLVALPWHLSARVGKFKQPFGLVNRTHPHDLPWVDAPAAIGLLAEDGYNDTGGTLSWVLPVGPLAVTTTAGALAGDPFEEDGPEAALAGLGRVEVFGGFGDVDVGVGGSAVKHFGGNEPALGADFSFRYRPSQRASVVVLGEVLQSPTGELGGYAALQVQPARSVYLGLREDILADGMKHNFFLSYYTSEFLRLRIGGAYAPADEAGEALAQLTFVWGSHPTEPWWVNR